MSIYDNSGVSATRTTKLNLGVSVAKTKYPSFSRRVSEMSNAQKRNSAVSSN